MKTIYCVMYDWAFNGGSEQGLLGVYETLEDATKRMESYWEDERAMEYLDEFDKFASSNRMREAWTDGYYCDSHSMVEVRETYLYSHDDVLNKRDR